MPILSIAADGVPDQLIERVEGYVERYPEASVPRVLGNYLLDPNDEAVLEAVEEIVDEQESDSDDDDGSGAAYARVGRTDEYPAVFDERDYYVPTARDEVGRKRPRAPHQNDHSYPAEWHSRLSESERPETDLETVERMAKLEEFELDAMGWDLPEGGDTTLSVGAILPQDRPPVVERAALIDWDDVRDPETGRVHPVCAEFLRRYPGYADISVSGTGVHQLVLGGLGEHGGKFIAHIDDEPAFGVLDNGGGKDDWPQVEIYDGGRHIHMSGRLVEGAENELYDGQGLINELIDRFAETATAHPTAREITVTETVDGETVERTHEVTTEAEYTGPDPEEWDIPDDRCLEYHAAVEAHYHGHSSGHYWRVTGAAAAWGHKLEKKPEEIIEDLRSENKAGASSGFGGKTTSRVHSDWRRAESGRFKPHSKTGLARIGVLPARYAIEEEWDIPENPDDSRFIEACAPLDLDAEPVDVHAARREIVERLYESARDAETLSFDVHPAGTGKTTSHALAAARRGDTIVMTTPTHENCREFETDPVKPDGFLHLKGASQPREDRCMDAQVGDLECRDHPDGECPSMCPAYDYLTGEDRELFTRLCAAVGVRDAHFILDLDDREWHGDQCAWESQFDAIEHADRIVTVHDYLPLKSVQKGTVYVDDMQGFLESDDHLSAAALSSLAGRFRDLASHGGTLADTLDTLADVADGLSETTCGGPAGDVDLDALDPDIDIERPDSVRRINIHGLPSDTAEMLSRAVRTYYDTTHRRVRNGDWQGEPFDIAPFLAALATLGDEDLATAARIAARQPFDLDACPQNHDHDPLEPRNGRRVCPTCGWDESESPRAGAEFIHNPARLSSASVGNRSGDIAKPDHEADGVVCVSIPPSVALPNPERVVLLDATPRIRPAKLLFGVDESDDVEVLGERTYTLPNTHVTQVVDGAYHRGTILADHSTTADRLQDALDEIADRHDQPLVIAMRAVLDELAIPDGCKTRHYGALRGLNETECDAVMCIGALHPPETTIRSIADALAVGTDAFVGGDEYSSRRGAPNPPIWRKYRYQDDDGRGRAVATKGYNGVVGELFAKEREDEIEQATHRIRPILDEPDNPGHAYLLTNVPTETPIDTLTTINAIVDPQKIELGVSDPAAEFVGGIAEAVDDLEAFEGTRDDLSEIAEADTSDQTVQRWLKELQDAGFLELERTGFPSTDKYSATDELLSLFE